MRPSASRRSVTFTIGALGCSAVAFATVGAAIGNELLVWLAAAQVFFIASYCMTTMESRPYWSWPGWALGSVTALMLASVVESARFLLLSWAGVSALVSAILVRLWLFHRDPRRDWLVCTAPPSVLRREPTLRAAEAWADTWWDQTPILFLRADKQPKLAAMEPLYPYRESPGRRRDEAESVARGV